eukprot:1159989-Pelagomonas_calceolata.AAC.13
MKQFRCLIILPSCPIAGSGLQSTSWPQASNAQQHTLSALSKHRAAKQRFILGIFCKLSSCTRELSVPIEQLMPHHPALMPYSELWTARHLLAPSDQCTATHPFCPEQAQGSKAAPYPERTLDCNALLYPKQALDSKATCCPSGHWTAMHLSVLSEHWTAKQLAALSRHWTAMHFSAPSEHWTAKQGTSQQSKHKGHLHERTHKSMSQHNNGLVLVIHKLIFELANRS